MSRISRLYIYLTLVALLSSCSANRFIPENQYLLDEVNILSDTKEVQPSLFTSYVRQNPNSKWFNLVKVPMHIYCLSGKDSSLIFAHKKEAHKVDEEIIDLGLVGEVDCINTDLLDMFLDNDYIPVISPVGIAKDGTSLNLNADTAAGEVASAVGAEKLIILTDVPGVLRDPSDPSTLIQKIRISEVPQLIEEGIISGGMIPKIECCVEAVRRGVSKTCIIDGRIPHSIIIEMLTDEGAGTMFV